MKKNLVALGMFMVVSLMASWALANPIDNTTEVYSSGYGVWRSAATNSIGTPLFDTQGADWNAATRTLTIYSNWGPAEEGSYLNRGLTAGYYRTADLFIDNDRDGTWDFSIGLDYQVFTQDTQYSDRDGNKYTGPIKYSDQSGHSGYIGNLARTLPTFTAARIPVYMETLATTNAAQVNWYDVSGTDPDYKVDIVLGNLISDHFYFMWGAGSCGNGPIQGELAPIPGTLVLLGSSLLGLVGIGWRQKVKS